MFYVEPGQVPRMRSRNSKRAENRVRFLSEQLFFSLTIQPLLLHPPQRLQDSLSLSLSLSPLPICEVGGRSSIDAALGTLQHLESSARGNVAFFSPVAKLTEHLVDNLLTQSALQFPVLPSLCRREKRHTRPVKLLQL